MCNYISGQSTMCALNGIKPRPNSAHAAGEILLGYQLAAKHGMDERKQLTFWSRNVAIHGFGKLILSFAALQSRKHPANRETLAHSDKTRFPRRVRIGDAVTWRKNIPLLPFAPYGLEQCDPVNVHVTLHVHSAAFPCCDAPWTGRRALWTGRRISAVLPGRGRATPIIQSRVTIAASCSSVQFSVPLGRTGRTIQRHF